MMSKNNREARMAKHAEAKKTIKALNQKVSKTKIGDANFTGRAKKIQSDRTGNKEHWRHPSVQVRAAVHHVENQPDPKSGQALSPTKWRKRAVRRSGTGKMTLANEIAYSGGIPGKFKSLPKVKHDIKPSEIQYPSNDLEMATYRRHCARNGSDKLSMADVEKIRDARARRASRGLTQRSFV